MIMQLAKIIDGQLINTCAADDDRELINTMVADGFKILTQEEPPTVELSEFDSLALRYRDEGFQIVAYYELLQNAPEKIAAEIERLKAELTATDYQITKSYEHQLIGQSPPYDIRTLHTDRQKLRDRIKELENIIP